MAQTIGDLILNILVKSVDKGGVKQITASVKDATNVVKFLNQNLETFAGKAGKAGFVLSAFREASYILGSTIRGVSTAIQGAANAHQQLLSSQMQLDAAAKLTGQSLQFLQNTAEAAKDEFGLSAPQANKFTVEISKLTQKAGEVGKTTDALRSLINLGAGQGLSTEDTLTAIKQAVLGIDDGTDKLFSKNPSVLYQEYADKIGIAVGKMTDQQKAQALLSSLVDAGGQLQGKYAEYLNTTAGKQEQLNIKLTEAKAKLGEQLQPVLVKLIDTVGGLLQAFNKLSPSWQVAVVGAGTLFIAVARLLPLITQLKDVIGGLGPVAESGFSGLKNAGVKNIGILLGKIGLLVAAIYALKNLLDSINEQASEIQKRDYEVVDEVGTRRKDIPAGDNLGGNDASLQGYFKNRAGTDEAKQQQEEYEKVLVDPKRKAQELAEKELKQHVSNIKDIAKDVGKGGTGKDASSTQVALSYAQQLNAELQQLVSKAQNQSAGENFAEGLYTRIKELNDELQKIQSIDLLGVEGYQKQKIAERSLKELDGIKVEEKKIRPKFYLPNDSDKQTESVKEIEANTEQVFQQSLSLASQISSVLGIGADTFAGKLLSGLQQGLSLANSFASLLSLVLKVSSGGIFSLLGFASGGSVPGAGSGDTVPAMLTPGEFVVRKSVVQKLGTGFFEWINGGGLLSSMVNKYATGGLVTASAQAPAQVYLINSRVKGNDIELALKRTNKINSRRLT